MDSSPEQAALEAVGWVRRTVSDGTRIGQLEEDYRGLGFETRVVAMAPDRFGNGCEACAIASAGTCLMLFTRRAEPRLGAVAK
jgi:hypothetical protein